MTNREIMEALYRNADTVWAEYHTGLSKSANVIYEGTEYVIFDEDKPILEEVQRRLEMSDWHTGTPTEEGEYLCWVSFAKVCKDSDGSWRCRWKDGKWYDNDATDNLSMDDLGFEVIAWQKIEPYKENEK